MSAASHLRLYLLPVSRKKDTRLVLVNMTEVPQNDCLQVTDSRSLLYHYENMPMQ